MVLTLNQNNTDRFIPISKQQSSIQNKLIQKENHQSKDYSPINQLFIAKNSKLLKFNEKNKKEIQKYDFLTENLIKSKQIHQPIIIQKGEKQILELGGFQNDYYLNSIDILGINTIGAILHNEVFIYDREKLQVDHISCTQKYQQETQATSLKFSLTDNNKIAIGNIQGDLSIVDIQRNALIKETNLHNQRIGCVEWNPKIPSLLTTGSKDKQIKLLDLRINRKSSLMKQQHQGEICGLSWNQNGYQLASGGNDNQVNIWDLRNMKQSSQLIQEHTAAVRAIKWCPWNSSLLATGGGSGDMKIIIHNSSNLNTKKSIQTHSQVCAIDWDLDSRSILTAHGFSNFSMCIWDFDSSNLIYEFLGHKNRVLSMIKPIDSYYTFTASADETL